MMRLAKANRIHFCSGAFGRMSEIIGTNRIIVMGAGTFMGTTWVAVERVSNRGPMVGAIQKRCSARSPYSFWAVQRTAGNWTVSGSHNRRAACRATAIAELPDRSGGPASITLPLATYFPLT
jgi:hypothetical protein